MLKTRPPPRYLLWQLAHPLWCCGFRPFFGLAALTAPVCIGLWSLFLAVGDPLPVVAGGAFIWHAHELMFGFGLAAVAGFLLTGVPEFTHSAAVQGRSVRRLVGLWLLGRVAFWGSGLGGDVALAVAGLAHLGLAGGLAALLAPRLWRDPQRRHLAFLWGLGALTVCVAGFYTDALRGLPPGRWLTAALGVLMVLIVVSMSRISMRIVNSALDDAGAKGVEYLARPPRRTLATALISLYTLVEFLDWNTRIGGWLALAAAAALLNLLNDWHVGRALFRRWPLMLYGVYGLMAAGYATMGLALLGDSGVFSAGRHLLTVGALGLSIYGVMCIVGTVHSGRAPDTRLWVPVGAAMLVAAALARAVAAWPGVDSRLWLLGAGVLWGGAFVLYAWHMVPVLLELRADGQAGCEGRGEVSTIAI